MMMTNPAAVCFMLGMMSLMFKISVADKLLKYEIVCAGNYNLTGKFWIKLPNSQRKLFYMVHKCQPTAENQYCRTEDRFWNAQPCNNKHLGNSRYLIECPFTPSEEMTSRVDNVWFARTFGVRITIRKNLKSRQAVIIPITPLLKCWTRQNTYYSVKVYKCWTCIICRLHTALSSYLWITNDYLCIRAKFVRPLLVSKLLRYKTFLDNRLYCNVYNHTNKHTFVPYNKIYCSKNAI